MNSVTESVAPRKPLGPGTLEKAAEYCARGLAVVPIAAGTKQPAIAEGWQNLRPQSHDLPQHFSNGNGIGLLLGKPSGGLVDVDLDSDEAIAAARAFLPATQMRHGRQSRPLSHVFYRSSLTTKKYPDIAGTKAGSAMLLELRSDGCQTVVPPSLHPSGEALAWSAEGEPSTVPPSDLLRAVGLTASAALLARHWPDEGKRHEASLALAGFLLRSGLSEQETRQLLVTAATIARDPEARARGVNVGTTTKQLLSPRGKATGGSRFNDLCPAGVGSAILTKLQDWLGLHAEDMREPATATPGSVQLVSGADLDDRQVSYLVDSILPNGMLALLSGKDGRGKTLLALEIVKAVLTGSPLFGETAVAAADGQARAELDRQRDGLEDLKDSCERPSRGSSKS